MLPIAFLCVVASAVAAVGHPNHGGSHLAARGDLPRLPGYYAPPQVFAHGSPMDSPPSVVTGFAAQSTSLEDLAKAFIARKIGEGVENLKVTSSITDPLTGTTFMHLVQTMGGIEISNLVSNVNLDVHGNIISSGHPVPVRLMSPQPKERVRRASYSAKDAVIAAAKALGHPTAGLKFRLTARDGGGFSGAPVSLSARGEVPVKEKFFSTADGRILKVWEVEVEQDDFWGQLLISAETNEPIASTNWMSDSQFDFDVDPILPSEPNFEDFEGKLDEDDAIFYVDDEIDVSAELDDEDGENTALLGTRTSRLQRTTGVRTSRSRGTRVKTTRSRETRVRTTRSRETRVRTTRSRKTQVRTTRTRTHRTRTRGGSRTISASTHESTTTLSPTSTATSTLTRTIHVPTSATTRTTTVTFSLPTTTTRLSSTVTRLTPTFTYPPVASLPTATFTGAMPTPTFLAVPFNEESMDSDQQLFINPAVETKASPKGWFDNLQINNELITSGNNVRAARVGRLGVSRENGRFDYPYNVTEDATTDANIDAAIANTFYVSNMYHDLLYGYGFDESSANFQHDNFGKGGYDEDAVLAFVQSADGFNNANFGTPPDGYSPRMRMYVFDQSSPLRDSDLDNGVIIHELTHGLSNRLTGGTGNANCLQTIEARGMGEGWSDAVAWWTSMKPHFTRETTRTIGRYVLNNTSGFRVYPYSTDKAINPFTYSIVPTLFSSHAIGTVWSAALYEVYWNMVDAAGFTEDIFDATRNEGNVRFLRNLVTGMKLQNCNPTFLSARDAFLQADRVNHDGRFVCEIWRGFSKRGLGVNATAGVENSELGDGCA
ncbi:hypothetical protein HDU67_004877 [Dinochytrium kinnereticum]|nr:hypothetical protein HDU67_004877 [Dinochytrium kinnereticum]